MLLILLKPFGFGRKRIIKNNPLVSKVLVMQLRMGIIKVITAWKDPLILTLSVVVRSSLDDSVREF